MPDEKDPLIPIYKLKSECFLPLSPRQIRKLIKAGQIKATDLNPGGKRRRWVIAASEAARFREEIRDEAKDQAGERDQS